MALFNSFKFGDVDSKDYGVYISGDSVYDSPARSVDLVQVPGRNGALALDNGYYENIEVTYPAGSFGTSQEEWREKMLGIRNALAAQRGYQKLIDTYHPEHYRLGMFFAGISASPVQYNRAGQFPIRFNCKPQRFLISGDEAVEFTAEGQEEVYGPANIVSFETNEGAEIRQLEVDLEPVQDLNGYDNPWPAGGGKNKVPLNLSTLKAMNSAGTWNGNVYTSNGLTFTVLVNDSGAITGINVNGTASANETFWVKTSTTGALPFADGSSVVLSGCPTGGSWGGTNTYALRLVKDDYSNAVNDIGNGATMTYDSTWTRLYIDIRSGVSFSNKVFKPMVCLATATDPKVFAPYSNICPITGHTEVEVTRTGKNLLGGLPLGNAIVNAVNNQTYASLGADSDGNYVRFVASSYIDNKAFAEGFFKPNTRYTLILKIRKDNTSSNTNLHIRYTDGSSENPKISGGTPYTTTRTMVFTTAANKTIQFIGTGWYSGTTYLYYDGCGIFEGVLTADAYEPYAGQTYNVPLGQTVYGGTLNVTTGVLTVDRAMVTLNGSENWTKSSSALNGFYMAYPQMKINSRLISDKFIYTASLSRYYNNYGYCYADSTISMNIDPAIAGNTVDSFKAWLAANPTQFVYYLATPITVQLTAMQVSTLLGQNSVWADSGEVEVRVASPVDLTNPTNFPAKPLIRVYGNGSVRVGDTIATVQNNADGYVDIDCESMNCYDTTGGRNADVSFSGNDFPELASGDNGILLTGPSRVEITPRWWEL